MTLPAHTPRPLPKAAIVAALWAWLLLLLLTHSFDDSPYSYGWALFEAQAHRLLGAVVNPDAAIVYNFTFFLYEGHWLDWNQAQNLKLPLHSFSVAMLVGITGSYLLASLIVNFAFAALVALAAVTLADRFALGRGATLVALLTFFSLPLYVEYLGQPLQYVAGPAVSFLVVMSVIALAPEDARNPWIAGLATALALLNYDPYIYVAALVSWFLFVNRFARKRDYVFYVIAAALPSVFWTQYLRFISGGAMTKHLRRQFIEPVVEAWTNFARAPLDNILLPFVASHVGVHVAFHQVIAIIYWPLLATAIGLLIRLRPRIDKRFALAALLPCFLVLEQIVAAGWDWELNPRRAIPVVLAFGFAYVYAVDAMWSRRGWRIAFMALFCLSAILATADTLFRNPGMAFLRTGQAMQRRPQDAIGFGYRKLDELPKLVHNDHPMIWRDMGRARLERSRAGVFAVTQAMCLLLFTGLFWLTARARILPRWSPYAAAGLWVVSLMRFLS
ncbi:MAG TPA: hypothetical protein VE974_17040 [Thermoanaerobaculia bacterium]|nr:hypothetical protein [Thermoanaerobaculia bacterium]